jgi:DNA-binding NarL/FixJ family response regulator
MPTVYAKARILVVEDDSLLSMMVVETLTEDGYQVIGTASNHQDAVALAVSERPDLVIMDVRLAKGTDGVSAAIDIFLTTGIAILFASSHFDSATIERAQSAQPVGWLPKPYTVEQLLDAVAKAMAQKGDAKSQTHQ